ncbi:MAG: Poly(hydroxyalcanoate) granule associated protein (phasin) [Myxococcaceae bacterium]|nr:Poly(hydroxyalcanoate) granule associated protein (phasin) [Myxococcaceae bacterium]
MDSTNNKDKRPVGEVFERFWSDAEKNVEEAVKRALAKVKVPRHSEIQALNARLDELHRRLEALSK